MKGKVFKSADGIGSQYDVCQLRDFIHRQFSNHDFVDLSFGLPELPETCLVIQCFFIKENMQRSPVMSHIFFSYKKLFTENFHYSDVKEV